MYSLEQRMAAVSLYIKYECSASATIRELEYPNSRHTLRAWYKEYIENSSLRSKSTRRPKYTQEQQETAIGYYLEHGKNIARTVRKLGYPSKATFKRWLYERKIRKKAACIHSKPLVKLSKLKKEQAVRDLCVRTESVQKIADKYNVSRFSLYNWAWQQLGKGNIHSMKNAFADHSSEITSLKKQVNQLSEQADELSRQVYKLQMEKDALEQAAELIKKEEGTSLEKLSNRDKVRLIGALRKQYPLFELLHLFQISKSSYCYQQRVLHSQDKYADLRTEIRNIFEENFRSYGYRRIHTVLRNRKIIVSEKVVRRIMNEENLKVYQRTRKKYSSYMGEITPAVPNIIKRDFHADKPNKKWLTDITEFHIPAGKVYLSPIIDCFDGLPVAWTIGESPDANLVNAMLDHAIEELSADEHPIIHSDRGAHYRWPGWIGRMEKAGLIRSMSKKGCSPDNSACEGFFGRLKNEMFYGMSWKHITTKQFMSILDKYLHWYAEERVKLSLGGMSPIAYRKSLGLIR